MKETDRRTYIADSARRFAERRIGIGRRIVIDDGCVGLGASATARRDQHQCKQATWLHRFHHKAMRHVHVSATSPPTCRR